MYFRVKRTGQYPYLQIVESFREGKSVKQRVLATVGRLDILQHSGQLEGLIRSGARFCEKLAVIDAHNAGNTEPVSVKSIGPDLVFSRLWEETHIGPIIRKLLSNRCFQFPLERAVYLTVLHRLFCPGSDRAAEKWRESFRIPGAESLELHHFYRTMGWLGEALDNQTDGLGQPHCNKDKIEEALFDRRRDLFSEIDIVFRYNIDLFRRRRWSNPRRARSQQGSSAGFETNDRWIGLGCPRSTDLLPDVARKYHRCQNSHPGG